MSKWPSTKARVLLKALERLGYIEKRQKGSHRFLIKPGHPVVLFAFHDNDEVGPRILAVIAKQTGLKPEDL